MHPLMPDTTTSTPRIARRSNILLVLAAISVTFMLFVPHIVSAQNGENGSCPGAQVVDTFSGNGSQTTPVFETTGESFRISYEATNTDDIGGSFLSIFVSDGEGGFISAVSQDGSGSGESFVNNGPGSYALEISSAGLQYDVTVEDCTGVTEELPDDPVVEELPEDFATDEPPEDSSASNDQYASGDDDLETPATGGPPLSVVAAILLWFGVGGILVARRFA